MQIPSAISQPAAVEFRKLFFAYEGEKPIFSRTNLQIPAGSRTLLLGPNGAGKSTLLQLVSGRHLLRKESLLVFGQSPFFQTSLAARIALVDGDFPITVDLRVAELLDHLSPGIDLRRQKELIDLLEVDLQWRMCRVSEGQRRRVQLLMALRRQSDLLLLDEITSHLDITVRSDLLRWLKSKSQSEGTTLIYATHILDGLHESRWPTHLAFLRRHEPILFFRYDEIPELKTKSLFALIESWIRKRRTDF